MVSSTPSAEVFDKWKSREMTKKNLPQSSSITRVAMMIQNALTRGQSPPVTFVQIMSILQVLGGFPLRFSVSDCDCEIQFHKSWQMVSWCIIANLFSIVAPTATLMLLIRKAGVTTEDVT